MKKEAKRIEAKGKFVFILFMFLLAFTMLFGKILYLKVVHGAEYSAEAKKQQINRYDTVTMPNRGNIVDRNEQLLAVSTTVYNVALDSIQLAEGEKESDNKARERTLTTLCEYFPELKYDTLKKYITKNPKTGEPYLNNHWKYLKKGVSRETTEKLKKEKLRGVYFEESSKRTYPLNELACHVIGFARGGASWGLEKYYADYMAGTPGRSFMLYQGADQVEYKNYKAKNGDTLVTTLDYNIQQLAEEVVNETQAEWPSENVAAIVMNPNTGEIYAMAESHAYDLNNPDEPLEAKTDATFEEVWNEMTTTEQMEYMNKTWRNFCVSDSFEPGSVYKPLVAAAGLEEGVITPNSTFVCNGVEVRGDKEMHCHLRSGHGSLNIQEIMAQSCNPGVIHIAERLGKEKFYEYQQEFGFGYKTGIDLPSEMDASGQLHSLEGIGPVELATMSFGQTFNCTAIQMITAFSSIINGGNMVRPHIVSQIIDADGNVVLQNNTEVVRKVISEETSAYMRTALKATVDHGLGKKIAIGGYSIGCKTGTAQQGSRKQDRLWTLTNMSYFPAENPQFIVFTIINKPFDYVDGLQTPAPMTKKLIEGIIKYKNMEPTQETENAKNLSKHQTVKIGDYIGSVIYDVAGDLDGKDLQYKVIGTGNTITNQVPKAGTEVDVGSEILLYVTKSEDESGTVGVPDVVGKSYAKAEKELKSSGFTVAFEGDRDGIVVSQEPKYGVSIEEGSEVILTMGEKETTTAKDKTNGNTTGRSDVKTEEVRTTTEVTESTQTTERKKTIKKQITGAEE